MRSLVVRCEAKKSSEKTSSRMRTLAVGCKSQQSGAKLVVGCKVQSAGAKPTRLVKCVSFFLVVYVGRSYMIGSLPDMSQKHGFGVS